MLAIETKQLTKHYGAARGVEDVNLSVEKGEIFGFIGPNGAGKSTTIRMLMGLSRPESGRIRLLGQPMQGDTPPLRAVIGYLPSEVSFYKELTGTQLLEFTARAYGLALSQTKAQEYADRLQFDMTRSVKSYSLGNRKKLGIIAAMIHEPLLLILDEPTSGLDPLVQQAFFDMLRERNEQGMTVFFSTHVLTEVEKLCQKVAFIKDGSIQQVSTVDDIPGRSRIRIAVVFEQSGDLIELYRLTEIDPNIVYKDGEHRITVNGSIHETLQAVSRYPIKDIDIRKPTLEELFMTYYEKAGDRPC